MHMRDSYRDDLMVGTIPGYTYNRMTRLRRDGRGHDQLPAKHGPAENWAIPTVHVLVSPEWDAGVRALARLAETANTRLFIQLSPLPAKTDAATFADVTGWLAKFKKTFQTPLSAMNPFTRLGSLLGQRAPECGRVKEIHEACGRKDRGGNPCWPSAAGRGDRVEQTTTQSAWGIQEPGRTSLATNLGWHRERRRIARRAAAFVPAIGCRCARAAFWRVPAKREAHRRPGWASGAQTWAARAVSPLLDYSSLTRLHRFVLPAADASASSTPLRLAILGGPTTIQLRQLIEVFLAAKELPPRFTKGITAFFGRRF